MKFKLVKSSNGINHYESEEGTLYLRFYKYSKSIIIENKKSGERLSLLYEELADLVLLKKENE